jgi:polyisoprenoid-binding protein YceI
MARSVAFRIHTASVSTNNQLRDRIIRGPQLLNSQEYPFIAFTSTRILSGRDGPGEIQGELSMNGNTRPVRFLIAPSPQSENDTQPAAAYRAVASISRDDFGIPSPMIGTSDTVHIQVSLELREEALQFASANRQEMTT